MMKKVFTPLMIAILLLLSCMGAGAAVGDVAGHIYSTDILALINGAPIPSYNIGGRTVVLAEDLGGISTLDYSIYYGFYVSYDDAQRLLTVESSWQAPYTSGEAPAVQRGTVGQILGDVYETDIRVLFNGRYVQGYNIGGKTAVCLEDLGQLGEGANATYGYSDYLAACQWNPEDKTIQLNTFLENIHDIMGLEVPKYEFSVNDNVLTATYAPLRTYYSSFISSEMSDEFLRRPYTLHPLYLSLGDDQTETEIGLCFAEPSGNCVCWVRDVAATKNQLQAAKPAPQSYEECLAFFESEGGFTVQQKVEGEEYTALLVTSPEEEGQKVVALSRAGGFVTLGNYTEEQVSISLDGSMLSIEAYPFHGLPHGGSGTLHTDVDLSGHEF